MIPLIYSVVLRFLTSLHQTGEVQRLGQERLLLLDPHDDQRVHLQESLPRIDRITNLKS